MTTSQIIELRRRAVHIAARHAAGAIGPGEAAGLHAPLLRAQITKMEKRGEIVAFRTHSWVDERHRLVIPYVRYKTVGQVRRERIVKHLAIAGTGLTAAIGVGWLLWSARYAVIALFFLLALAWPARHWRNGCTGLHCDGCGGR